MGNKKLSNVISTALFIFLSIISFGIYEVVWFYRNWKYIKEKEGGDISPFWRAFFSIFFITQQFRMMLNYAKKEGYKESFSPGWMTFWWFILALTGRAEGTGFFMSILTFLPLLGPLTATNYYYHKRGLDTKPRPWQWWHILLIAMCAVFWVLIFVGISAGV